MARATALVDLIAALTGLDHAKVTRHARFAREAGYLSQAARGRSAAHMTAKDAAHLLASILNDGIGQDAGMILKHIGCMEIDGEDLRNLKDARKWRDGALEQLRALLPVLFEPEHSFIDLLVALIEQAASGSTVFVQRYGMSYIEYHCGDYYAFVNLQIDPHYASWRPEDQLFLDLIYLHPQFSAKSNLFRMSTQLKFETIARVGELIAHK